MLRHIFYGELPDALKMRKGKMYVIYRATPNNPKTMEVMHGVRADRAIKALSRRNHKNIKSAWLSIPAEAGDLPQKAKLSGGKRYHNITMIKDSERHFDIVHHERTKPSEREKPKWLCPIAIRRRPRKSLDAYNSYRHRVFKKQAA